MSKTLLVGAGAECIEPFGLLAGKEFTFDTCYYQNEALYEALEEFYRGRLSKSVNQDLGTPLLVSESISLLVQKRGVSQVV